MTDLDSLISAAWAKPRNTVYWFSPDGRRPGFYGHVAGVNLALFDETTIHITGRWTDRSELIEYGTLERLSVPALAAKWSAFKEGIWCRVPTRAEIQERIDAGLLDLPIAEIFDGEREQHLRRVAWFAANSIDPRYPITVDLACGHPWPIRDGNHRLAGAEMRGDTSIMAVFRGTREELEGLRG